MLYPNATLCYWVSPSQTSLPVKTTSRGGIIEKPRDQLHVLLEFLIINSAMLQKKNRRWQGSYGENIFKLFIYLQCQKEGMVCGTYFSNFHLKLIIYSLI